MKSVSTADEATQRWTTTAPATPLPSAELAAHRPTLAAAWEARAAADALDALGERADDPAAATAFRREAAEHQRRSTALLKTAMVHANHQETLRRLAEVPALATVFQSTAADGPPTAALGGAFDQIGVRAQDWWRVGAEKSAPAGGGANRVQDQIQAYFESLSKAQRERK